MKKVVLVLVAVLAFNLSNAQSSNGIYFKDNKINAEVITGIRAGLSVGVMVAGVGNVYSNGIITGKNSQLSVSPYNLEFNFVIENANVDDFNMDYKVGASSVNDFALVKLKSKRKRRELRIGKVGGLGALNMSIDSDDMLPFSVETTDNLNFKVKPTTVLESGEYAFVMKSVKGIGTKVWSFSISN